MKFFAKSGAILPVVVFFFMVFGSLCPAAEPEEKGLQVSPTLSGSKVTLVKIIINAADSGPKVNTLQLDYPVPTVLTTTVSLTVKKGAYKIELLENDKPAITLTSQEGKTVKGSGRLSVNADGAVQYRVTAKKAKDVTFDLSFNSVQDELRVSRAYSEERFSSEGDGLNLKLNCIAGKNCLIQVQNISRLKSYRNISFQIDYKLMSKEESLERSKCGTIGDVLMPGKTGEWPIDLVFGEPPKDIRISVIKADEVASAQAAPSVAEQRKEIVLPLVSPEKLKKSN